MGPGTRETAWVVASALSPAGEGASEIARLTWILVGVLSAVYLVVMALFVLAVRSSRRRPEEERPRWLSGQPFVVVAGIAVPAVILLALMSVTAHSTWRISAPEPGEPEVEVIAHQFWWEVRYPQEGFETANEIHIPVGRPVTIVLRAGDVIHSFWVPELHGKIDNFPGRDTTLQLAATRPGVYRGQCAEFCGLQHALMAFLVVAQPDDEYEAWLADQRGPAAAPVGDRAERGREVFMEAGCQACHAIRGTEADGELGPDLTRLATRRTLAAATLPNTRGHLGGWILDPQASKPGNLMPPTSIAPDDLQALLDFLEGLD